MARVLILAALVGLALSAPLSTSSLKSSISADNVLKHLQAFETIANLPENKGSRAVWLGYNQSVDYVVSQLRAFTNYEIRLQYLPVTVPVYLSDPILQIVAPEEVSFQLNTEFLGYNVNAGGAGDVKGNIVAIRGGCDAADFRDFPQGSVALLNRGTFMPSGSNMTTCAYRTKITNAYNAGAAGILLYNPDDVLPTLGGADAPVNVPVFGLNSAAANYILELGSSAVVRMVAQVELRTFTTINIIAETRSGSDNDIIVVGSHLDSVPAGAGINDNGSGSAVTLEIALEFYRLGINPTNKVRFAWWAAEEWGLLGAYYYVKSLSASELSKIALNLNYDMIGSPNFMRGVYDGRAAPENIRTGCTKIQVMYELFFNSVGKTYVSTPFTGRSDYGPFIEVGIPAGGLFSGAEELKSVDQRNLFGGSAYTAFDTCYHRACDNVSNISYEAIDSLGNAAASVAWDLAQTPNLREFLGQA